jgi:hypothetical protein
MSKIVLYIMSTSHPHREHASDIQKLFGKAWRKKHSDSPRRMVQTLSPASTATRLAI